MWDEREKLKKCLSKKEPELEELENSQFIHTTKNVKVCSKYNTKDVAKQSFDKEVTMDVNQALQPKPATEMGLYQQTILACTKRNRDRMNKREAFGFLQDETVELFGCEGAFVKKTSMTVRSFQLSRLPSWFQRVGSLPPFQQGGLLLTGALQAGLLTRALDFGDPMGLECRALNQRWLFVRLKIDQGKPTIKIISQWKTKCVVMRIWKYFKYTPH